MLEKGTHPLPFFWKCVKRKGFKSFVLKLCESKGVAGAFLRNCINLKELGEKVGAQGWFRADLSLPTGPAEPSGMQTAHTVVFLCSSPSTSLRARLTALGFSSGSYCLRRLAI